ncbi:hypothetical protein CTI14_22245 [Methylobacterium radiotolerans]|nr:hypothetical protein CTI14_22245 [Methylobacterium radiotolerans]
MSMLKVVLVTGISGSGKSVALRMLEDASYTCVDQSSRPLPDRVHCPGAR